MIYDLLVVGNGIAAQTFLFELFNRDSDVKNSQNFSVAQIYADEISPPCSLRSTATVALSGIDEGVSPLGNELYSSYYLFEEFVKKNRPCGVEEINQFILHSTQEEKEKLVRRYQSLCEIQSPLLKKTMTGIEMHSYQITPSVYKNWFEDKLNSFHILRKKNFVRSLQENDQGHIVVTLLSGEAIKTKKILLATGAYSKIFSRFYQEHFEQNSIEHTGVLSGAYLERSINLNIASFFISLDGNKCVYRSHAKELVIGSVSQKGPFELGDVESLKNLISLYQDHLTFDLGRIQDYKIVSGLRHKGRQRRPIYKALDAKKQIYMISGFYKNGFTFAHLAAKEVLREILKDLSP